MEEKGLKYESKQVEFSKSERTLRHLHPRIYSVPEVLQSDCED